MSVIMMVGCKDYIVFAGDGRGCLKDGQIHSENIKKVHQLNSNIIIGFGGSKDYCDLVMGNTLDFVGDSSLTYNLVLTKITKRFKELEEYYIENKGKENVNIAIAIAGNTSEGLKLSTITYFKGDSSIDEISLKDHNEPIIKAFKGSKYPYIEEADLMYRESKDSSIDNFKQIFKDVISNGSKLDFTINKNITMADVVRV